MRGADKGFVNDFSVLLSEKTAQKSIKTQNSLTGVQVQILLQNTRHEY
jgi:hypothetical protein